MENRVLESIKWLSPTGQIDSASEFTTTTHGILVNVGVASEVMIPWSRVLEYMGPRGNGQAHHE